MELGRLGLMRSYMENRGTEWAATGGLIHVSKFANMEHFSPTLERAIQIWSASFAASGAGGPEVT